MLRNGDVHKPQYIIDIDVNLNIVHLSVNSFIYLFFTIIFFWEGWGSVHEVAYLIDMMFLHLSILHRRERLFTGNNYG